MHVLHNKDILFYERNIHSKMLGLLGKHMHNSTYSGMQTLTVGYIRLPMTWCLRGSAIGVQATVSPSD